ncbi:hypothetical protein ABMA28_000846 [Loxostege sticticalis]|uniref:RHD domain-containing protein n=1 Tax=Loxostege sticticalis TaxID=481309 RepID=A0ABD0T3T3_LOXSC
MVGTHGCLLGESSGTSKTKTHPTVELVNYKGRAIIRCRLAQKKSTDEHPHKLLEEEQDRDVSYEVPENGSFKVGFAGMGIIHTAKKDVPGLLYKKYSETNRNFDPKELRMYCENEAKGIDLNIVRLRFSAHDIVTNKEICPPVFSKPIHNLKSAATNDLKITRASRTCGRASGGDDVFLLVEKVNKKNIMVRLFELNENGEETWSANGHFLQSDVHHQYAIVFRTPPYQDKNITSAKKVFIELVRPSDGRTSEPKEFEYKPEKYGGRSDVPGKKRRANSSYSSYSSSTSNSLKSNGEVPATVLFYMNQNSNEQNENPVNDVQMCTIPQLPQIPHASPSSSSDLGEAILYGMRAEGSPSCTLYDSPMMPQGVADPPDLQLNSAELERILKDNPSIPADEKERFCKADWSEYLKFTDSLSDIAETNGSSYSIDIVRSMLASDSGRVKKSEETSTKRPQTAVKEEKRPYPTDKTKGNGEYSAFYKAEDGAEVKKLVKELCEMIRNKSGVNKQIVRAKLERLFEMRLSNGDTFLHMTLCSKQPSLDYIVKLIHSMKMTHLLNLTNNQSQTILHLAVVYDMPKTVSFLVSKGCNPMIEDSEGNNALHYAVIYQNSLETLLAAIKSNNVPHDLNAYNNEKQTPLHLAVIYKSVESVRLLLASGAGCGARDGAGRTPLHLAALDDALPVAALLLQHLHSTEIDATDGSEYTALQMACDGDVRENTLAIVKLLLDKGANPLKCQEHGATAWKLAKDKPEIREVMRAYLPAEPPLEDDVKSEPEDEPEQEDDFESADEGEACGLRELPLYIDELAGALDAVQGWRALAKQLELESLHSWYANTRSPARTLLNHIKECGENNVTSKSLAMVLENIGQKDAANIIRKHCAD